MQLNRWSTTAANNNAAVPDGAPEGWLGSNVNDWGREVMARVREQASDAAYIDETYNLTPSGVKSLTRNSTTQFSVLNCDATSHFTANRRIRIVGSTTGYGYVVSSTFSSPNTNVDVVMESGDVPTAPTVASVHVDTRIRSGAYSAAGAGGGLDADKLDGLHAADILGPSIHAEALTNGSMMVWQRGTSGSCPAGTRTFHADRWWTNPAGAAVTCERTTTTPTGAVSRYAKKVTGAASVTTCDIAGQRIEAYLIPYIKTTVTFSALVQNDTASLLTLSLLLGTPSAEDNFATVVNRLTQSLTTITAGSSQRVSYTVDISGYTNINNGLEVIFRVPSPNLNDPAKSVTITEIQIDRATTFSHFRYRPFPDEFLRCKRYYQKTFAYETAPAQNWAGGGAGLPAGALAIPGSSFATGSDNTGVSWPLSEPMRATPSVTTYNPRAADAQARDINDSNSKVVTVTASTSLINLAISANTADRAYCVGVAADAEL